MHRKMRAVAVLDVDVWLEKGEVEGKCVVQLSKCASKPLHLRSVVSGRGMDVYEVTGAEPGKEPVSPPRVALALESLPTRLVVNGSQRLTFVGAVRSTLEPQIDGSLLERFTEETLVEARRAVANASLKTLHEEAWDQLWMNTGGGIELSGNMTLARQVNASLMALLSSVREDWAWSVSEGGVGSNAYDGHVFWSDSVMDGPILGALFPRIVANNLFVYREQRLSAARALAEENNLRGAYWPWQSAATGLEQSCGNLTLVKDCYWMHEVHIGADLVLFLRMTWYRTGDDAWLVQRAWPIIRETARFFQSKVVSVSPQSGNLTLKQVIGPDEHSYIKDSNTYTNYVTAQVFKFGAYVARRVGGVEEEAKQWEDSATRMYIPVESFCFSWPNRSVVGCKPENVVKIHPQYEGYHGEEINQADVALMQWPWHAEMDRQVAINDLQYYATRTGVSRKTKGFFTGDSSMSIAFLQLRMIAEGVQQFMQAFRHILPPWNLWTELDPTLMKSPGHLNFLTGAGGFLENLLFGFGGIQYKAEELRIAPVLPPFNVTSLLIRNLNYRGRQIEVQFNVKELHLRLVQGMPLYVRLESSRMPYQQLRLERKLIFPRQPTLIKPRHLGARINPKEFRSTE